MKAAVQASLQIDEVGDAAVIKAQVTREVAAMIRTVLDHYRDTRYHHGNSTGTGADGDGTEAGTADGAADVDPVTGNPIRLTNAQRDAQALADWVTATLDRGLESERQGERPHLDITATLTDLATGVGAAVLNRTGLPDGVASTTLHTARRHGCDAFVRLILIDGQYRDPHTGCPVPDPAASLLTAGVGVLDYGRSERIVPARLRRALAIRDRGCAFPGCHRPPAHTQAHHVQHWLDLGDTSLANTVLLCSRHHHYVHEGGWTITARAGMHYTQPGYWQFTRPRRRQGPARHRPHLVATDRTATGGRDDSGRPGPPVHTVARQSVTEISPLRLFQSWTTEVRSTTSCTERFCRLTAHQNRPIGKATQNAARSTAMENTIRSPRKLTTRTPISRAPTVRPVVAQATVR